MVKFYIDNKEIDLANTWYVSQEFPSPGGHSYKIEVILVGDIGKHLAKHFSNKGVITGLYHPPPNHAILKT